MAAESVLGRQCESQLVTEFLDSSATVPAALVIEGEPGIGKTTLWQAGVELARARGFDVLVARAAPAESVLAYAALADLLDDVGPEACARLPAPQRSAIDAVLLRGCADDHVTDPRAVAAGFLSILNSLEDLAPVLLALDDLQWLDSSSMRVLAFAARRLRGRMRVLATLRTDADNGHPTCQLELPRPAANQRMRLGPLSLGALREVVGARIGRPLSRATLVRIYEASRGNPFYALELAWVTDNQTGRSEVSLPGSLAELVRTRIGSVDSDVRDVLLAAACASAPTVELVARATGTDVERVVWLLDDAANKGIVEIDGNRVYFTHPLLARGVYSDAAPARRREMHRIMAGIIAEPELKARHLAMAVAWGDPQTLECLDSAADIACTRGAPAAAAELIELALGLGGDTPERRIRLAANLFRAGDSTRARVLLDETIASLPPGRLRAEALSLLGPVRIFGDSFVGGVAAMERALEEASDDLALCVPTLITMLLPLFNSGRLADAALRAQRAVVDAERLGEPVLLSRAISLRIFLEFLRGEGLDEEGMKAALEMDEQDAGTAVRTGFHMIVRPRSHFAMLLGWTGRLDRAHDEMVALQQSCLEHGLETELIYVIYYRVQVEIWRGQFDEVARLVEQGVESALQAGGEVSVGAALTWRAALAAYAGDEEQVRRDVSGALEAMKRCGARMLERWPIAIGAFLEVSLGNYDAALATLEPLLSELNAARDGTEIYLAEFVPDAVEAMIHVGRLDAAEPFIDALERNGRRLDRAWMLAVGARCRSMLLAARGCLDAATAAAESAMAEHDRLPMPFERARTQLLLGQLQRRGRRRDSAAHTLREALAAFESMSTPLWAERARTELTRATANSTGGSKLTESEQRVAELAASGMTNRDVAAALFISSKTVEANLTRVYRKLGIHSRAELGRLMGG